jgi:prepilin-type N-terminal cleavage/methylation domain-containing protein
MMKMRKNGFTIIEVMIAMVIGLVIMVAVYGFMSLVQKNSSNVDRKIVTFQDTRTVLDLMATEIRMASYNPNHNITNWNTVPACASMAGWGGSAVPVTANRGIQVADANNILIAMDLDGNATIGDQPATSPNEYIMYSYDAVNADITRNVSCGGNSVILGGAAPGSNVRNTVGGVTIVPLFQYYDNTNTLMPAPINIPAIRRILITIIADTADIDLNTKQPKRMVYSTSVIVRNHAF